MTSVPRPHLVILILLGVLIGLLSGVFGVGGGVVLVPLLTTFLGYGQRLAAGTSLAAILPAAAVGGSAYALQGHVNWAAAVALAVGVVLGAQLGSLLLVRLPVGLLRWLFMAFLLLTSVSLWLVVPQRDGQIGQATLTLALLVGTGILTGVLSGVLGVGGGVIVVPALMLLFGASDLEAKGTSLIMLVPGAISGTLGNARRKNMDGRAAMVIGAGAALCAPVGTLLAGGLTPFLSNVIFSALLAVILLQLLLRESLEGSRKTPPERFPQPPGH